jgi:hypothetical protein
MEIAREETEPSAEWFRATRQAISELLSPKPQPPASRPAIATHQEALT